MIKEFRKNEDTQLSDHFNSLEFDCHCDYPTCRVTYIESDLIDYLEKKRALFAPHPIKIMSGFRCVAHNNNIGGKLGSIHLVGKAADIQIPGHNMIDLAHHFEDADGLGRYPGRHFLHVDLRGYKARWEG